MNDYNPMQHFQKWFYEADELFDEREPNVMQLTTVGADKYPNSRMVLLKKYTWEGFIFFTNYKSNKAKAITLKPEVCLLFNWPNSKRMVQILGRISKISREESSNYFALRPRGSKLGAWASHQSQVISSRKVLEDRLLVYEKEFENKEIPIPDFWGGYIVKPVEFTFLENLKNDFFSHCLYRLQPDFSWSMKTQIH